MDARTAPEKPAPHPLWVPSERAVEAARMTAFRRFAEESTGRRLPDYAALWEWSTTELDEFWGALWDFYGLDHAFGAHGTVLAEERMPGSTWFPQMQLNYAEYVLAAGRDNDVAIVGVTERGDRREISWRELRAQVGSVAAWLRSVGVGRGDRVVGYLPNIPEAVVAMLATTGIGAIWSSVGQDYAPSAAVDRLGPLEAKVLVTADSYVLGGRDRDRREAVTEIVSSMPSTSDVLVVHRDEGAPIGADTARVHAWSDIVSAESAPSWQRVGFDDPLWVLFSSGTTGRPKGLVQSHGGILLEELKLLGLHLDLGPGDRLFWFTSPSWVMWNIQASALATGASIVCYDGSPTHPDARRLWQLVAECGVTVFGSSPGYLDASRTTGIEPAAHLDLSHLRALATTGSPLSPVTHEWATRVSGGLPLYSVSGGTDICTAFCGGAPIVPIWPGELSVRNLGVAMDAWDGSGAPVHGEVGELVMTRPMPSMPVTFWNDPDGSRYLDAYFGVYPNVWRHGDWITITDRDSIIIHGRSDSTLNRNGVRMGSADIYNVVEALDEVAASLVLGVEEPDGGYWMPLFVVLAEPDRALDDALADRIRQAIRDKASPRHVPDEIIQVAGIPHTRTGKRLEVPIKRMMQGAPPDSVVQRTALEDPTLLEPFIELARRRRG